MKNNVPDLRFQGFHDQWTLKYLEELAENFIGGGTPKTGVSEYWTGDIPWIQSSDLIKHKVYGFNSKKSINDLAIENSTTKIVPKDSIAVVTRVGVGKIALFEYQYSTSQDFLSFSKLNIDKWFGVYLLYNKMQKELKQVQGTSIKGITKAELLEKKVLIPKINEQIKIGVFFRTLDENICLHQKELEILKQTKQGFLQKMFPQEGELVPKIRFSEYKSEWKSIKLSNLTTLFTDGDWIESKDQSEEGIRLIQTGNIGISKFLNKPGKEKWITEETFKKLKCQEIYAGDILISRLPEPAGRACILPSLDTRTITAVDCTIIRVDDNSSSEFLLQYLSTNQYFNVVKSYLGGGTRQRISRSVLGDLIVRVPKELTEQVKIGEFFKQLDEVIDLKEQELDALKQTKQGFLQKMFV